jgi:hypothetical protein
LPHFEDLIDKLIVDAHPAVRLQATLHLIRIWDIDREGFWRRAEGVVRDERNGAVLDHFVTDVLGRLTGVATTKVAETVLYLRERVLESPDARKSIYAHLTQIITILWISHQNPNAKAIVASWQANPIAHVYEVCVTLGMLRAAVTAGLRGEHDVGRIRQIAQTFFAEVVSIASNKLTEYSTLRELTDQEKKSGTVCMKIIDDACQQIYFASGVFGSTSNDGRPDLTKEQLHKFFLEISKTLRLIGDQGGPHTIYYLIQLLEHLIDFEPEAVFDLVANALLKGGRDTGYQYESMGADLFVRVIGLFLADHKQIFDNPARRQALIDCLETFLFAGWPAARRLLYHLPELIQ